MKKVLLILSLVLSTVSLCYAGDVSVKGYYRKDGTYVAPYHRSSPDSTVTNNYGYKGNVNPYTGAVGTNYNRNNPTSEYYGTTDQSNHQTSSYNYGSRSNSVNDNDDSSQQPQSSTYSYPYSYSQPQRTKSDNDKDQSYYPYGQNQRQTSQSNPYFTMSNPNRVSDSGSDGSDSDE